MEVTTVQHVPVCLAPRCGRHGGTGRRTPRQGASARWYRSIRECGRFVLHRSGTSCTEVGPACQGDTHTHKMTYTCTHTLDRQRTCKDTLKANPKKVSSSVTLKGKEVSPEAYFKTGTHKKSHVYLTTLGDLRQC